MNDAYKPFSEREGHRQPKPLQIKSMDERLRKRLWNAFYHSFPDYRYYRDGASSRHPMYSSIWQNHSHNPANEYNKYSDAPRILVKDIFYGEDWDLVFDLIEFCMQNPLPIGLENLPPSHTQMGLSMKSPREQVEIFKAKCNRILQEENSAYKIVGKLVVEITSEQEVVEIETVLKIPFDSARSHLEKALALLSSRENPDYENSIKESISAVESIAKEVTGKEKSLNALTQSLKLHPNLANALNKLYNWTSKDGIRHGKSGKPLPVDQATARFMLVTCSAFVNYIIANGQDDR